jgi:hypothetical protein
MPLKRLSAIDRAILGITTSPQSRESPETAKDQLRAGALAAFTTAGLVCEIWKTKIDPTTRAQSGGTVRERFIKEVSSCLRPDSEK